MELKENSFLAKYYRFMFDNLPKDFCTLFWNILFATIFFPLTIAYYPFAESWNKNAFPLVVRAIFGAIVWMFATLLGVLGAVQLEKLGWEGFIKLSFFLVVPIGLVFIILAFAIIIAIAVGTGYGISKVWKAAFPKKEKNYEDEVTTPLSKLSIIWSTIRNKYCTKIDWK